MNIFKIFGSKQSVPPPRILKGPTETEELIQDISSLHSPTKLLALSKFSRQLTLNNIPTEVRDLIPVLMKIFSENPVNQSACGYAAKSLGQIKKEVKETIPTVLPALVSVIEDKNKFHSYVRGDALVAVGYFGKEAKDVIPLIISSLGEQDLFVAISAGTALAEISKEAREEVRESLINNLNNSNDQIRGFAIEMFGIIFKEEAVDAMEILINGLNDKSNLVRRGCALALGYIGKEAKSAIPNLVKLLADKSNNVAKTATWALTEIAKKL